MSVTDKEKCELLRIAEENGADHAAFTEVSCLTFEFEFRKICETNTCGNYGECWTCPPFVGNIGDLIAQIKNYREVMAYQTISKIEDSFDIEGMLAAGDRHNSIAEKISTAVFYSSKEKILHLAAGGCRICPVCAKREDKPCRNPDRAFASLESYGISVYGLGKSCGLSYYCGN